VRFMVVSRSGPADLLIFYGFNSNVERTKDPHGQAPSDPASVCGRAYKEEAGTKSIASALMKTAAGHSARHRPAWTLVYALSG